MEADKRVDTVFPDGSPPPREGSHNSYYSFTDEQLWPHIVRASGSALSGSGPLEQSVESSEVEYSRTRGTYGMRLTESRLSMAQRLPI